MRVRAVDEGVIRVFIPTMLRHLTAGVAEVAVEAETVGAAIDAIDAGFPGFRDAILEDGELRPGLAVSVDSEISVLGVHERLAPGSELHFLPALGGGGDGAHRRQLSGAPPQAEEATGISPGPPRSAVCTPRRARMASVKRSTASQSVYS